MKIDKDLKQVAKDVRNHPEWLEGSPDDLRQIVDELNAEILDGKSSKTKRAPKKPLTKKKQ